MSFLTSIISSIKASSSNKAYDQMQAREMHDKVIDAVKQASADNEITAEEITEIEALMDTLNISSSEMNAMKEEVLENLVKHILEDNKVTEQELKLLEVVQKGLKVSENNPGLIKDIEKIKSMAGN